MFSFLYRVFYDRSLPVSYVKNGKGCGLKPLLFLTLFAALCVTFRAYLMFSSVPSRLIDAFTAEIPEIVVQKGKILSPADKFYSYVSDDNYAFFVFDTTGQPPRLTEFAPLGIYVTTDAIYSVSQNESHRIPFVKILKDKDISLNRDDIRAVIEEISSVSKVTVPVVVFLFALPGIFLTYMILSLIALPVSFVMTHFLKTALEWNERCRLVVLSVLPAGVVNSATLLLSIRMRTDMLSLLILSVYMYCFLKECGKNKDERGFEV